MNLADNNARSQSVDSLLNYETVKYYGCEDYEVDKYRESVTIYQVIFQFFFFNFKLLKYDLQLVVSFPI